MNLFQNNRHRTGRSLLCIKLNKYVLPLLTELFKTPFIDKLKPLLPEDCTRCFHVAHRLQRCKKDSCESWVNDQSDRLADSTIRIAVVERPRPIFTLPIRESLAITSSSRRVRRGTSWRLQLPSIPVLSDSG